MVKRFHDSVVSGMSGRLVPDRLVPDRWVPDGLAPDRLVLFMTSADINIRQGIRASQVSIQIVVFGRYAPGRLELVASYTFMKAAAVSAKASNVVSFVKSVITSNWVFVVSSFCRCLVATKK